MSSVEHRDKLGRCTRCCVHFAIGKTGMRILLVEDEQELVRVVARALSELGMVVDVAMDGAAGLRKAHEAEYDAIILDLMLPRLDGQTVLQQLRRTKSTPVLVLTARDSLADKVRTLNIGADDYLTKPFSIEELAARVAALVRRSVNRPSPVISLGDIEIDTATRAATRDGELLPLTAKEYGILELLVLNQGRVVSRGMIYEHVYGEHDDSLSNVLDVHLSNLRRKVGRDLIETRRGHGYLIRNEE